MGALVRLVVRVTVVLVAVWAIAQALARKATVGDESSDEFELAAYFGGAQRRSTAGALRHGVVRVCSGGVDLDLREATLASEGATLELSVVWGGVQLTLPEGWRVLVESETTLGGVDARVTPPEQLPDDAPTLTVTVAARMGGVAIRESSAAPAPDTGPAAAEA